MLKLALARVFLCTLNACLRRRHKFVLGDKFSRRDRMPPAHCDCAELELTRKMSEIRERSFIKMVHLVILLFFIPSVTSTCFVKEQPGEKRKIIDRKTPLTIEQCEIGCSDDVNCKAYAYSLPSFCVHLGEVIGAGCIGEVNVKSDQCGVESTTTTEVSTAETKTTPEVTTTTEITTTTPTTPTTTTTQWNPVIPTCKPSEEGLGWRDASLPYYVKDNLIIACGNGPKLFRDPGHLYTTTIGNHYPFLGGPEENWAKYVCGMAKSDDGNVRAKGCIDTWLTYDQFYCVDYTPPTYSRCCTPIVEKSLPIGDNLCGAKPFKSWKTSTQSSTHTSKLECTPEGWKADGIIVYPFSGVCFVKKQASENRQIIDSKSSLDIAQCEIGCMDNNKCKAYAFALPSLCVHLGDVNGSGCLGEVYLKDEKCESTTTTEMPTTPQPWNPMSEVCKPDEGGLTDIITKDPDFNKDQKYVKDNFRLACANGPRLFRDSSGNHYPFLGVQNSLLFILNGMAKKSVGGTGEDRISLYPKQLGDLPCVEFKPPTYPKCCTPIVQNALPNGDSLCGDKGFKSWKESSNGFATAKTTSLECTPNGWTAGGTLVVPFSVQCG
ncbi:hypothetical protein PRIPAC_85843 [Pristionchus pacificus]|uniref:Uncharacterized protein n=1 Tax=Pristionchus pacificus TaxID=54126 RepID=A0A2A6BKY7_PRIPA|nr:hypothetical protein PRIPAC_85843 [Pristionchus pacificus]|eukprot:PDM66557.1 hypothetical protein PRIPAC_47974 [Pristionchus pacificus]